MKTGKTENRQVSTDAAPLFASVWLTLFNELRKNYAKQRSDDFSLDAAAHPETRV